MLHPDIDRVFIDEERLRARVIELGARLGEDYKGKCPLFISILRGSFIFLADLVRAAQMDCTVDFMAVSSYGNKTTTTGAVKITKDLDYDIEGRHVIIVEDIIDSGLTINFISGIMSKKNPASVRVCALLDKPSRRKVDLTPDYCGFAIPDEFVVGYGLDYADKYRFLPYIGIPKDKIISG